MRNFIQALEPPLAQLLPSARFVKLDHNVGFVRFEVRRWVVECQVAVFADSDKRYVDGCLPNFSRDYYYFFGGAPRIASLQALATRNFTTLFAGI